MFDVVKFMMQTLYYRLTGLVTLQRIVLVYIMSTYDKFSEYVAVRSIRWGYVTIRWHTLSYVVHSQCMPMY